MFAWRGRGSVLNSGLRSRIHENEFAVCGNTFSVPVTAAERPRSERRRELRHGLRPAPCPSAVLPPLRLRGSPLRPHPHPGSSRVARPRGGPSGLVPTLPASLCRRLPARLPSAEPAAPRRVRASSVLSASGGAGSVNGGDGEDGGAAARSSRPHDRPSVLGRSAAQGRFARTGRVEGRRPFAGGSACRRSASSSVSGVSFVKATVNRARGDRGAGVAAPWFVAATSSV